MPAEPSSTERRRVAYQRGLGSETRAMLALMLKGYRPLARRYTGAGGEIDLIVKRGRTIAFVEVKARARIDAAQSAIDGRKRSRFSRAVRSWLARNATSPDTTFRADAVFVVPGAWPIHVMNVFEIEGR